jgi:hypothetical protein
MLVESASIVTKRRYQFSRLKALLLALFNLLLAISPALPNLFVYHFSWRLEGLIGHWPVYLVDDPKFAGPDDFVASFLYSSVCLFGLLMFSSIVLFPIVTYLRSRYYPAWWTIFLVALYLLCWVLSRYDPALRWKWYFD